MVYNQAYNQSLQMKETKQTFFQYISSFQYFNSFGLHEKRKPLTSALVTKIGFVTGTNWLLFGGLYQHAMNDIMTARTISLFSFWLTHLALVYNRNHYFGLGPIPKPKPKLADTFGRYRNRYWNHILKGESISHYLQLKLLSGKNARTWDSMDFT